ncbi:MAG: formylglycine-generating enzyme family protein [Candidatus Xenobia bacterium]
MSRRLSVLLLCVALWAAHPVAATPDVATPSQAPTQIYPPGAPKEIVTMPDHSDMVLVPAGEFLMGSNTVDDEMPAHTQYVDAFYMDRYEVTNRQFADFVKATGYVTDAERKGWSVAFDHGLPGTVDHLSWRFPAGPASTYLNFLDHPVVCVSWNDAVAYATWAGKRLPTEAEWEKAARGVDARQYPWGNSQDESRSVNRYLNKGDVLRLTLPMDHRRGTLPVGSLPGGASPFGLMDMAGNVQEWVEDWYHSYPGNTRPVGDGEDTQKVQRGGGWDDDLLWITFRGHAWPQTSSTDTGFRTCRDVIPAQQNPGPR